MAGKRSHMEWSYLSTWTKYEDITGGTVSYPGEGGATITTIDLSSSANGNNNSLHFWVTPLAGKSMPTVVQLYLWVDVKSDVVGVIPGHTSDWAPCIIPESIIMDNSYASNFYLSFSDVPARKCTLCWPVIEDDGNMGFTLYYASTSQ